MEQMTNAIRNVNREVQLQQWQQQILENGSFKWPRNENEAKKLTPQQIRWLLEGLTKQKQN